MDTARISDRTHYIGTNDRATTRFEGMWPLPLGVSYNSYLVTGSEKTAIIDGVEASKALRQIEQIRNILGDRHPDYLIINHMEPDHSGAVSLLRKAFPGITVVGNQLTLAFNKGFYGPDNATLLVKDGDTLSLGEETTLRFALAPMVHWPETMVTYLEQEQTLFSGDAFGCFGALNGAVLDTQMNTDRHFPEMVRYYTNIVGKYGAFVQKAIAKLRDLPIATICPTHGPVWHERIPEVMDIYNRLSLYEPLDNGATIVYGSMYGNTELMAETAARALAENGVKEISVINASYTDISYTIAEIFRHRGLVIASPTYSDSLFPPVAAVIDAMALRGIRNRDTLIIGGHTWSQQAIKRMQQFMEGCSLQAAAAPVNFKHAPAADNLHECYEAAAALARILTAPQTDGSGQTL